MPGESAACVVLKLGAVPVAVPECCQASCGVVAVVGFMIVLVAESVESSAWAVEIAECFAVQVGAVDAVCPVAAAVMAVLESVTGIIAVAVVDVWVLYLAELT